MSSGWWITLIVIGAVLTKPGRELSRR